MFGAIASCDASVQPSKVGIGIASLDFSLSIGFNMQLPGGFSNKIELFSLLLAGCLVRSDTTIFVDNRSSYANMNWIIESLDNGLKCLGKRVNKRLENREIIFKWRPRRSNEMMCSADSLAKRAYISYDVIRVMANKMEVALPSESEFRNYLKGYGWWIILFLKPEYDEQVEFITTCLFEADRMPGDFRKIDELPDYVMRTYNDLVESVLLLQDYYKSHRPG